MCPAYVRLGVVLCDMLSRPRPYASLHLPRAEIRQSGSVCRRWCSRERLHRRLCALPSGCLGRKRGILVSYSSQDPWLLPLLRRVRERPGSYLGYESVRELDVFLDGYTRARIDLGLPAYGRGEEDLISAFNDWIKERYHQAGSSMSWRNVIEMLDASSRNIYRFYDELDAFLSTRGINWVDVAGVWPPETE